MNHFDIIVIVSAGAEWRRISPLLSASSEIKTPYPHCVTSSIEKTPVVFLHSGWGKVASAGATQYAIDRWTPKLLINLGTCGGLDGRVLLGEIILASETVIYDIIEGMSDYHKAIDRYRCLAHLDWLGDDLPIKVMKARLLSADRDIRPQDVQTLIDDFDGIAGDWESGAFAWVADKNKVDWLILRGVTDLISLVEGEALGNVSLWQQRTGPVMQKLYANLPWLIDQYKVTH
jgi:adenosylhomocysteine nucleosidase